MPTPDQIVQYYKAKAPEYIGKYDVGGHVHAHVGQYSRTCQPELFRSEYISPRLGSDRLKYLMHAGQEANTSMFFRTIASVSRFERTLDCGAGFGGNSWLIANRYGAPVDALTISPDQISVMAGECARIGPSALVNPILGNAFYRDWWTGRPYDLVVGYESFCQMGNLSELLHNLSLMQDAGGLLAISDHFMSQKTSAIARYFDEYWVSESSELGQLLDALNRNHYALVSLRDESVGQLPYWRLSQAYSELPTSDRSDSRRSQTLNFHRAMENAYEMGDVRYFQIIARRLS